MLNHLEIKHTIHKTNSKNLHEKEVHIIVIRGPERVKKWTEKVGFNNPVQYTKYLVWEKFGFCPIRTTLEQRKLILKGGLDPYSLYDNKQRP